MPSKKKGFKIPLKTATLVFEGDYEGAEVEVLLDVSLGDLVEFLKIDEDATLMTLPKEYDWWVERGILRNWNLEDENGNEIPVEPGCMNKIPRVLAREIMRTWFNTVLEISPIETKETEPEETLVIEELVEEM